MGFQVIAWLSLSIGLFAPDRPLINRRALLGVVLSLLPIDNVRFLSFQFKIVSKQDKPICTEISIR